MTKIEEGLKKILGCNRTIMVLKPVLELLWSQQDGVVAIEPLWYWNAITTTSTTLLISLLQSNHYGIETSSTNLFYTFNLLVAIESLWYWNFSYHLVTTVRPKVAIEPLWYWNEEAVRRIMMKIACCNRTIMVLKLRIRRRWLWFIGWVAIEPLWYWNVWPFPRPSSLSACCNRTIMVLKRKPCRL